MKQIMGRSILGLTVLLLMACGTKTVDSIHPLVRSSDLGQEKRIVILPFSDYTPLDSPMGYWYRNVLIMEALQDEILRYGFQPAVSENVVDYLARKNIIRRNEDAPVRSSGNVVIQAELAKDWSDSMKYELERALAKNMAKQGRGSGQGIGPERVTSIALDYNAIKELGREFSADYVIRGRIVVFKSGREDSFNPLQTGVLPFIFNTGSRALFGIAESDKYEMIDKIAVGGLLGAVLAPSDWPLEGDSTTSLASGHPRLGGGGLVTAVESYSGWNSAIWGGAGTGLAYLSHKGGRVDNAVVQLRMIVQDTRTGEIIWTNRAEVKAMTESAFNKKDSDTLMGQALRQVCGRLFDNFVATTNNRRIVRFFDDGTLYVTPVGGMKPHRDQCNPYYPIQVESSSQISKKRTNFAPLSRNETAKQIAGGQH